MISLMVWPVRGRRTSKRIIALEKAKDRAKARDSVFRRYDANPSPMPTLVLVDGVDVKSTAFLQTPTWKRIRYDALVAANGRCECCGASPADGVKLNVDHIKPRAKRPDLAADPWNLQVLCSECNEGKGNRDATDWR